MNDIRILAVDDESGVLRTLQSIFSDYFITTESDPLKAAELIRRDRFNLFLIDYQMPIMNGIELLEEIKYEYKNRDYIAILCTASGTTYLFKEEFTQNLFSYYVEKPFNVNNLKKVVAEAIIELLTKPGKKQKAVW